MQIREAIEAGSRAEALRSVADRPVGLQQALGTLRVAAWLDQPAAVRRAVLAVRGAVLATVDPPLAAAAWLELAHGLLVTDPDAAAPVAAEAAARCRADLPARSDEAATLLALLGAGPAPPDVPPSAVHGDLLHACAHLAGAPPGQQSAWAQRALQALAAVPGAGQTHGRRWLALAEAQAGLVRVGPPSGTSVVLDTLQASIEVGERAAVSLAKSRRRFDLLLALARLPDLSREALFEQVWGHRWQGPPSKNALQATVSRARQALKGGLEIEANDHGGYRLAGPPTVWVRGPLAPLTEPTTEAAALVGRGPELARLRDALAPGAWTAVWGPPGAGKSRLAREVARTWGARVVWVDLREVTTRTGVLAALAHRLGTQVEGVGEALRARTGTLVVLDDLDDLEDQPLDDLLHAWRRGGRAPTVLTTHRHRRAADAELHLHPLSTDDAATLLARHGGAGVDEARLRELAEQLDGLPLALELVGRHVAVLGADEVLELLPSLLGGTGDPLSTALGAVWDALDAQQQRDLGRLSLLGVPLPREAALALVSGAQLEELASRAVVQDAGETVELLRSVARFAGPRLDPRDRDDALAVLVRWARALPEEAYGPALPALESIVRVACANDPAAAADLALAVVPSLSGLVPTASAIALAEATIAVAPSQRRDELLVVHAATLQAAALDEQAVARLGEVQGPLPDEARQLALLVRARLALATGWDPAYSFETPEPIRASTDAAVAGTTGRARWAALTLRGGARLRVRDIDAAREDLELAAEEARSLGGVPAVLAQQGLARCDLHEGAYRRAVERLEPASRRLRQHGLTAKLRPVLQELAVAHQRLGRLDEAERYALEALALHEALGDPVGAGPVLLRLASITHDRGDLELALRWSYRAQQDGTGAERATWSALAAEDLAAAVHLELGQVDAARHIVAGDVLERTSQGVLVRMLLAARDRDVEQIEGMFGSVKTLSPAVLAMWGTLRHVLGVDGAPELVRRGRADLPPDEVGSRYAVEVAEHVVLGAPLLDPVPPSYLARALLEVSR